jgi:hypothetical protein
MQLADANAARRDAMRGDLDLRSGSLNALKQVSSDASCSGLQSKMAGTAMDAISGPN